MFNLLPNLHSFDYQNHSESYNLRGPSKCPYSMSTTPSQTKMTEFFVTFTSGALDSPEYIGPFYSEDDAYEYADDRNSSLALGGVPSSVACYSVN